MAVKDVRNYYFTMQAQLLEMKQDLDDFKEALQNGFITEDKMKAVLDEVSILQTNYDRLSYIMFLLEKPSKKYKQTKYNKINEKLIKEFKIRKADEDSVVEENNSALAVFRSRLEELKKNK